MKNVSKMSVEELRAEVEKIRAERSSRGRMRRAEGRAKRISGQVSEKRKRKISGGMVVGETPPEPKC